MVKKITIDPRTLLAWTTSTNYRIAITDGLVREVGNNRSLSPAVSNQQTFTTFDSGPYVTSSSIEYSWVDNFSTATIYYNRQIRSVSTSSKFYLTSTSTGILHTFSAGDSEVTISDPNKVRLDLSALTIPEGSYYINCDAGVVTDNFNFPSIAEIVVDFSETDPKIFYVASISNMKDRNYSSGDPNKIFLLDVPQIVDVDSNTSTIYTLTLSSNIGEFIGTIGSVINGTWVASATKQEINQIFQDIQFDPFGETNPDGTYTYHLEKNSVNLVTKTLSLLGIPFILGGNFSLYTTPKVLHWYKNVPFNAILTTSTIFSGDESGKVNFNIILKDGVETTQTLTSTVFTSNIANIESIEFPSTGTFVIRADWEGRTIPPKYYGRQSNTVTINAAEREYYPGTLTLSHISNGNEPTIADRLKVETNFSTSTKNSILIKDISNTGTIILDYFEFSGLPQEFNIAPGTFNNTSSHKIQLSWEGQEWTEGENFYPYYGTTSNILTLADRANYPGSISLLSPTNPYQFAGINDFTIVASLNTNTTGIIHIEKQISSTTNILSSVYSYSITTATSTVSSEIIVSTNSVNSESVSKNGSVTTLTQLETREVVSDIVEGSSNPTGIIKYTTVGTTYFSTSSVYIHTYLEIRDYSLTYNYLNSFKFITFDTTNYALKNTIFEIVPGSITIPALGIFGLMFRPIVDKGYNTNFTPPGGFGVNATFYTGIRKTTTSTIRNVFISEEVGITSFENSTTAVISIPIEFYNTATSTTFRALWEGQTYTTDTYPYYGKTSDSITQNVIPATLSLFASTNSNVASPLTVTLSGNTGSRVSNIVKLYNNTQEIATSTFPYDSSSIDIIIPAGTLPLSSSTTFLESISTSTNYTNVLKSYEVGGQYAIEVYTNMNEIKDYFVASKSGGTYDKQLFSVKSIEKTRPNDTYPTNWLTIFYSPGVNLSEYQIILDPKLKVVNSSSNLTASITTPIGTFVSNTSNVQVYQSDKTFASISLSTSTYQNYDSLGNENTSSISATVLLSGKFRHPTGVITLSDQTGIINTATLSVINALQSQATISWIPLQKNQTTGTYHIIANYSGDVDNLATTSTSVDLTIIKNIPLITVSSATYITTGSNTGKYLSPITLQAEFIDSLNSPSNVSWKVDNSIVGTNDVLNGISTSSDITIQPGLRNISLGYDETLSYKDSATKSIEIASSYFPQIETTFNFFENGQYYQTLYYDDVSAYRYTGQPQTATIHCKPVWRSIYPIGSLISDRPAMCDFEIQFVWMFRYIYQPFNTPIVKYLPFTTRYINVYDVPFVSGTTFTFDGQYPSRTEIENYQNIAIAAGAYDMVRYAYSCNIVLKTHATDRIPVSISKDVWAIRQYFG